ncbi:peptidase inhibitor family I36 protein [Pseudomonas sp. PDM28]|uniref:peptidase inhibitor family I36 protein n=1 Tax=Pseudomonas sp. PDM28 TaxID=2854770 RepID=UPI001C437842|nr:peptidase inhibitor family I36 protein [Pseudomonas sp. PDM28]MBV7553952.1 peptidase inhibitor family I36 protein [Pseudomonas sp. PDM28]
MKIKWVVIVFLLIVCLGAVYFLNGEQESVGQSKYTLLNPSLTELQKDEVQQQIDQQLARKAGTRQVSATQVVYGEGAVVMTFLPKDSAQPDNTCDYGYFCVWEHPYYTGRKVSVRSKQEQSPVNLADYDMSLQVSSWKYNNKPYASIVYGVSSRDGKGQILTSTLKEIGIGDECCPFSVPEKTEASGAWTEIYSIDHLQSQGDKIVSISISTLFGGDTK